MLNTVEIWNKWNADLFLERIWIVIYKCKQEAVTDYQILHGKRKDYEKKLIEIDIKNNDPKIQNRDTRYIHQWSFKLILLLFLEVWSGQKNKEDKHKTWCCYALLLYKVYLSVNLKFAISSLF